jgi:hypothetical protein
MQRLNSTEAEYKALIRGIIRDSPFFPIYFLYLLDKQRLVWMDPLH